MPHMHTRKHGEAQLSALERQSYKLGVDPSAASASEQIGRQRLEGCARGGKWLCEEPRAGLGRVQLGDHMHGLAHEHNGRLAWDRETRLEGGVKGIKEADDDRRGALRGRQSVRGRWRRWGERRVRDGRWRRAERRKHLLRQEALLVLGGRRGRRRGRH